MAPGEAVIRQIAADAEFNVAQFEQVPRVVHALTRPRQS
jgi:hypothetical protein